jgi:hypothetical protein
MRDELVLVAELLSPSIAHARRPRRARIGRKRHGATLAGYCPASRPEPQEPRAARFQHVAFTSGKQVSVGTVSVPVSVSVSISVSVSGLSLSLSLKLVYLPRQRIAAVLS